MYNSVTMKRTNIHLTHTEIERLRKAAKETGLTAAEIIRRAVDQWLEKYESNKGK